MQSIKENLCLYAITDRSWLNGMKLTTAVEAALKGGATFVQLREKKLDSTSLLAEALAIKALCEAYHVPFIINDHVMLAQNINADGVHIGQNDMPLKEVRTKLGKDKIIGVSVHNVEEALRAESQGATYLGVGAVFPTSSKSDTSHVSYDMLKAICNAVTIPVIAIGGITSCNIMALKQSGICGVAVISAIFAQNNIYEATAKLKTLAQKMVSL